MNTTLAFTSFLSLLAGAAAAQDARTFAESLFVPSGPSGPATVIQMWSNAAPGIGNTTELVLMAPGRTAGGVLVATSAGIGSSIPLPCGYGLLLYVDPATVLGTIPVTLDASGRGAAWLSVPWNYGLVGLDLAFQGFAMNTPCDLGLSNLVVANVGTASNQGNAVIGHAYGPLALPAAATWSIAGTRVPVVTNMTSGNTQPYRWLGTKTPGVGPLQLVDQYGTVVASVPAGDAAFTLAVGVAPNRRLFWRNGGSAALTIQWTLSAIWF